MQVLAHFQYYTLLLLPCFLWSAYHYYKDRHRPEPVALLVFAIILGYGSAYLGLFFYSCLHLVIPYGAYDLVYQNNLPGLFGYAVLAIGPIEELAKFVPFLLILTRFPHFDEPFDGVIYASFIALGFALHENQMYLSHLQGAETVGRALASPIVHALFASIWGYAYGYADTHQMNRRLTTMLGFLVSAFIHGVYDFFAIWISVWTHIVPAALIFLIWLWRMWVTRHCTKPPLANPEQ